MRIELFDFDCVSIKLISVFQGERRIKVLIRRLSGFEEDAKCLPVLINTGSSSASICVTFLFKKNVINCYPNET